MSEADATDADEDEHAREPRYTFKPRAFGTDVTFRLTPGALVWSSERGGDRIPWGRIARVRASFDPRQMASSRWKLEIWPKTGPKVWLASASFVSLVESSRNDLEYRSFVLALHERLAMAGSKAVFAAGRPYWAWLVGAVLAAATFGAMAVIAVRGLVLGEWGLAAVMAAMIGYFGWQMGRWFLFNRPRTYRPEAIPPEVLPPEVLPPPG